MAQNVFQRKIHLINLSIQRQILVFIVICQYIPSPNQIERLC